MTSFVRLLHYEAISAIKMSVGQEAEDPQGDLFALFLQRLHRRDVDQGFTGLNIKIKKELGSGVFGTVYHGQIKVDPDDGSPIVAKRGEGGEISSPLLQARGRAVANVDVAIKVVPLVKAEEHSKTEGKEEAMHAEQLQKKKDKRKEKQRYSRALEEARNLSKVSKHPSVVTFVGAKFKENELWLITEYCSKGNLNDHLRRGDVPLPQRQKWYYQLLSGVEFLHRCQIGHFDLKPHNILLDQACNAKIADFGISAAVSDKAVTILGVFKYVTPRGSLPYMAPEGFSGKLGLKADIFSLGLVYVTIAERPVFEIHGNEVLYYPVVYKESKTQKGKMKHDFLGRRMAVEYNRGCSRLAMNSPDISQTGKGKDDSGDIEDASPPNSPAQERGECSGEAKKLTADSIARAVGRLVLKQLPWQHSTDEERRLFCSMLRVLPQHRSENRQLKELIADVYVEEREEMAARKKSISGTQRRKSGVSASKLEGQGPKEIPLRHSQSRARPCCIQ